MTSLFKGNLLKGKHCLVTGGANGIGRAIVGEFLAERAAIITVFDKDETALSAIEIMFRDVIEGARIRLRRVDITDRTTMREAIGSDTVDVLVNNAGITFNKPFFKITPEQFDMLFHVNIRAQFFLVQRVARDMLENGGGVICNLASIHGLQGAPEFSAYAATKGAIIAYTRALAVELACKGIRINAIAPGMVDVENNYKVMPGYSMETARETARNKIPAGFPGEPLDVAKLAVFLCSEDARYIVGQTIVMDGGTTSLMSLIDDFRGESDARFGTGYLPGV